MIRRPAGHLICRMNCNVVQIFIFKTLRNCRLVTVDFTWWDDRLLPDFLFAWLLIWKGLQVIPPIPKAKTEKNGASTSSLLQQPCIRTSLIIQLASCLKRRAGAELGESGCIFLNNVPPHCCAPNKNFIVHTYKMRELTVCCLITIRKVKGQMSLVRLQ